MTTSIREHLEYKHLRYSWISAVKHNLLLNLGHTVTTMASNTFDDDDDSLYSESINDRLSPTDGYFDTRQHPQDFYIENGRGLETSKNNDSNTIESLLDSCLSRSLTFSDRQGTHSSSSEQSTERTPLLRTNTPPPAYRPRSLPAPSGFDDGRRLDGQGYGGVAAPFLFPGSQEPQTMRDGESESGGHGIPNGPGPNWRGLNRSSRCRRTFVKMAMLFCVAGALSCIALLFLAGQTGEVCIVFVVEFIYAYISLNRADHSIDSHRAFRANEAYKANEANPRPFFAQMARKVLCFCDPCKKIYFPTFGKLQI
jgi:hypothetical protein